MIYRLGITTPANTSESDAQQTILKLTAGIIHQVDILFPPGPSGLLHVQINRGLYQIWPSNPGESFAADNNVISFREHHEILQEPYQIEIYTWNIDDTYSHTITVRIGLLRKKFILRRLL